jgi:hypothetical protein
MVHGTTTTTTKQQQQQQQHWLYSPGWALASSTTATAATTTITIIPYNRNTAYAKCKNESDTSNNRGKWNHLKITQTIPEQHTQKAQNQGTTKNSHIGYCIHTWGSTNVKVQNIFHV